MKITVLTILLSLIVSCGKSIDGGYKPAIGSSDVVTVDVTNTTGNTGNTTGSNGGTPIDSSGNDSATSQSIRTGTGTLTQTNQTINGVVNEGQSITRVSYILAMDNSEINEDSSFNVYLTNTGNAPINVSLLSTPVVDGVYSYQSNNCGTTININQVCSFSYKAHLIQNINVSGTTSAVTISYASSAQTARASINIRIKNIDYIATTSGYTEEELNTYLYGGRYTVRDCITTEQFGSKGVVVYNENLMGYICQFKSFDHNVGYSSNVETKLTVNHLENFYSQGVFYSTNGLDSYFCPGSWKLETLNYDKARVKKHTFWGITWIDVRDPEGEIVCTDYNQLRLKCAKEEVLFPRLMSVQCY